MARNRPFLGRAPGARPRLEAVGPCAACGRLANEQTASASRPPSLGRRRAPRRRVGLAIGTARPYGDRMVRRAGGAPRFPCPSLIGALYMHGRICAPPNMGTADKMDRKWCLRSTARRSPSGARYPQVLTGASQSTRWVSLGGAVSTLSAHRARAGAREPSPAKPLKPVATGRLRSWLRAPTATASSSQSGVARQPVSLASWLRRRPKRRPPRDRDRT
jgi:hypothetical protein